MRKNIAMGAIVFTLLHFLTFGLYYLVWEVLDVLGLLPLDITDRTADWLEVTVYALIVAMLGAGFSWWFNGRIERRLTRVN